MAEKKETGRIRIILDASKVNRCSWCGIPISDDWVAGRDGSFCSRECLYNSWNERRSKLFPVCEWLAILLFLIFLTIPLINPRSILDARYLLFIFSFIFSTVLFLVFLRREIRDHSHDIDRPKDSRRNIGISEVSILRSISTPVECPNCDGLIDLANIGDDMVYRCQYCGASGVLEIKLLE
jgi:predicted nucleic acid-binding Zn ribbon protein